MLTLVSLVTELFGQVILTDSKQFINAMSGQNNPIIWEENCSQGQNFIFKSFEITMGCCDSRPHKEITLMRISAP